MTRKKIVSQRETNQTTNGKPYEERFVAATQKLVQRASDIAAAAADEESVLVVGDAGVKTGVCAYMCAVVCLLCSIVVVFSFCWA